MTAGEGWGRLRRAGECCRWPEDGGGRAGNGGERGGLLQIVVAEDMIYG